jgi:hypothetical protein
VRKSVDLLQDKDDMPEITLTIALPCPVSAQPWETMCQVCDL